MGCSLTKDLVEIKRLGKKLALKNKETGKLRKHIKDQDTQIAEKDHIILVLLGKKYNKGQLQNDISTIQKQIEIYKTVVTKKIWDLIDLLKNSFDQSSMGPNVIHLREKESTRT